MAQWRYVICLKNGAAENLLSTKQIASEELSYTVKYSSKRRSIALQIVGGELRIRAPLGVSTQDIDALVAKKRPWIVKHLHLSVAQAAPNWLRKRCVPLHGVLRTIHVQHAKTTAVVLSDNVITLSLSARTSVTDVKLAQLLKQWFRQQAIVWFTQRVLFWQQKMELAPSAVMVGNWKTKWGYCKSNAELGFNWRLLMAPEWVADYVIVHELAHLRYMNHSAKFWQLVQQFYPSHSDAKLWLKQHQYELEL